MTGRGGKRDNAGRKPGSKSKTYTNWVKIGSVISPEAVNYLNIKSSQGPSKSHIINAALLLHQTFNPVKND